MKNIAFVIFLTIATGEISLCIYDCLHLIETFA